MKLSLSYNAVKLLKHVLAHTGESEVNDKGQDVLSPRRLNGEESAQRRHFSKAVKSFEEEVEKKTKEAMDAHNEKVSEKRKKLEEANPKLSGDVVETDEQYETRIVNMLGADKEWVEYIKTVKEELEKMFLAKGDIELTDKTFDVVKKYFREFGDKAGYMTGDDDTVSELDAVL